MRSLSRQSLFDDQRNGSMKNFTTMKRGQAIDEVKSEKPEGSKLLSSMKSKSMLLKCNKIKNPNGFVHPNVFSSPMIQLAFIVGLILHISTLSQGAIASGNEKKYFTNI